MEGVDILVISSLQATLFVRYRWPLNKLNPVTEMMKSSLK